MTKQKIIDRVTLLRNYLKAHHVDGYIVNGSDPHLSEYAPDYWGQREYFSGFTGSAGMLAFTLSQAGLWSDSRYFLQGDRQVDGTPISFFKDGLSETPSIESWLVTQLPKGATIAIDGSLFSAFDVEQMSRYFTTRGYLFLTDVAPWNDIWEHRPAFPQAEAFLFSTLYTGLTAEEKIVKTLNVLAQNGADSLLVTALDEVAWLYNLRGNDVGYNPVTTAYAFISHTQRILFIESYKLNAVVRVHLAENKISVMPYEDVFAFMANLATETALSFDKQKSNFSLYTAIPHTVRLIEGRSPIALLKACKNRQEIAGIKQAMLKDGVALVHFMRWLQSTVGKEEIDEVTIGEKLIEYRSQQSLYVGESFPTIAGYESNGAIVHYKPEKETASPLKPKGMILIDSGAQYFDGTTDITRTIALGEVTAEQRRDYTLVLKGHIAIASCIFPQGTRGAQIDVLARKPLWDYQLNYLHGTGHGVGHFLNVHEGPQSIRLEENPTALQVGMITSNEPGVYHSGKYGIRLENLTCVVPYAKSEFGEFLAFETLTLCPFDVRLIDKTMLTDQEIQWINQYHERVVKRLSPFLHTDDAAWLSAQCVAI